MTTERNVFVAIMRAFARGQGLHLTADEVGSMAVFDVIERAAILAFSDEDGDRINEGNQPWPEGWKNVKIPRKETR